MTGPAVDCPLCEALRPEPYHRDRFRDYLRCPSCGLVFVPPSQRPDATTERTRYDLHRNDPGDPGYRRFLLQLCEPLCERSPPGSEGLDFGCGPGDALARLFAERGRKAIGYDPFYAPDESVWTREWDFIAASEVLEHLHRPARELDRLFRVLKPGGWLGFLTGWLPDRADFAAWPYLNDPTHIAFYGPEPFARIAERWKVESVLIRPRVALFRKPPGLR